MPSIATLTAREVFDSRGTPTIEVDVTLDDGAFGRASVPSGASTGDYEAVELRDGDTNRLKGKGVQRAVANVNQTLADKLRGQAANQAHIDNLMIETDGTSNKGNLGANAILGISLALAKAIAISQRQPLWEYFRQLSQTTPDAWVMPVPMMNVMNGGKHAIKSADFQEFMIMPVGAGSFRQAMDMGVSVFMALKQLIHDAGHATSVGDEGGFAPSLGSNQAVLDILVAAVEKSGLQLGKEIVFALDPAASEFYHDGQYVLESEGRSLSSEEMIGLYEDWANRYPLVSVEDGLDQDDWAGTKLLTERLGDRLQIVGDDLFVTNVERLQRGISEGVGNAILIKLNQIGTVTETVAAIDLARQHNFKAIVSHRSGETEDTTIADFVVGLGTGQIKTGSLSRTDRVAKYNQLLRIEEQLGTAAHYPGMSAVR